MPLRKPCLIMLSALFATGCATAYSSPVNPAAPVLEQVQPPPVDPSLPVLERLKQAQLSDKVFAPEYAETLRQDLGAQGIEISRSEGYTRAVISRLPGFERGESAGYADLIVERWDLPTGPVVQVAFRPKMYLSEEKLKGLLGDYLYYDKGYDVLVHPRPGTRPEGWYASPPDFSIGFYCSSPGIERKIEVGVAGGWPLEYRVISRRMPDFDGSLPSRVGTVVVQPDIGWTVAPDSPAALYPARAQRVESEGVVRLACRVPTAGTLEECEVENEHPKTKGFASSALVWSKTAILKPVGGASARPTQPVYVDLDFTLINPVERCPALSGKTGGS